jgi:hypothetical protein
VGTTARKVAPHSGRKGKFYLEALGNKKNLKRFKLTVISKGNQPLKTIKELLKSQINPTEIKVGINTFKSPKKGKVLIETNSKDKSEVLEKDINTKCGGNLEANNHKLRNPRPMIFNFPQDTCTKNLQDTLMAQNPDLNLKKGDIEAKFNYTTKKQI